MIARTLDTYQQVVGRPAKAWLSSAIRGTLHTPAFLKEFGVIAYCDYLNDDQPYLIDTMTRSVKRFADVRRASRLGKRRWSIAA